MQVPLFAKLQYRELLHYHTIAYQKHLSTNTDLTSNVHIRMLSFSGTSDKVTTVLELDAAEIEEEEVKIHFSKRRKSILYFCIVFTFYQFLFLLVT